MPDVVRLFVLGRSRLDAEVLAAGLAASEGLKVVGAAATTDERALGLIGEIDVVVVDAGGAGDHPGLVARVQEMAPAPELVLFRVPKDSPRALLELVELGARGFVLEGQGLGDLLLAIRGVRSARAPLPPGLARAVLERLQGMSRCLPGGAQHPLEPLSEREREVLHFLARRANNKEIAHELGISLSTVKNHVHRILKKLEVRRRQDAVRRARRLGVLEDETVGEAP